MSIIEEDVRVLCKNLDLSKLRDKSILITGASGLIGVYLLSCLKKFYKEYNIKISVLIKNNIEPEFESIFDLDSKYFNIIQDDISNINYHITVKFDYIIHAAGYGQPGKFLDNKIKTIQINTTHTIDLLNKLKDDGTFLFVSTSELYSGIDNLSVNEDNIGNTNTNHPRSCYIESKRCGESICHAYKEKGRNIKIARLSLAYGPGTKKGDHRVLNSLIEKAIKNDKIELMDQGKAIRTYCYITDVIEMFWNILLNSKDVIYNVGGISTITILDLAKNIGKEFNKDVLTPIISNELAGNPNVVNISIEKYITEFNKKKFISLDDGLRKTIQWQKNIYKYE